MNNLSGDDLLKVLNFLPGDDISRFSRLSKGFANLIRKHQRILKKPKISVALEKNQNENYLMKITTSSERSFVLIPDYDFLYIVSGPDELCKPFKEKFESELDLNKILEWIFSKADVEALHLQNLGSLSLCVIEALKNSNCRCFEIHLNFSLFHWTKIEKVQSVFTEICDRQRKLGVSIKLHGADSLMMFMFSNSKIPLPFIYGELFQEISFTHDLTSFHLIFQWASKQWEEGNLTAENAHLIRIRFRQVTKSLRAASIRLSMLCRIIFKRESQIPYRFSKFDRDNVTEAVLKSHNEELRIQYKLEEGTFFVTMQVVPCL